MYHETTLYIKQDNLERLDLAAGQMNVSRSRLVSDLLVMYIERNRTGEKAFEKLRYQKGGDNVCFCTRSLCLRKDFYEKWCDVRKAYKLSASFIVSLAIEYYLDELLKKRNQPYNCGSMYITKTMYSGKTSIQITITGYLEDKKLKKLADFCP